jgi:hypothetical protein
MAFPGECPICKTVLSFPEMTGDDPVRCPSCNTRFVVDGRNLVHLSFTDYYALLGVAPNTDVAEIRKLIRAKILEYHPDHNPDDPKASERLIEVIQAKELLTDPEKRRLYDSVYFAPALLRWSFRSPSTGYRATETSRPSDVRPPSARRETKYEEVISQARTRSKTAPDENIEHLIDEIEKMFASQGMYVDLRRNVVTPNLARDRTWGIRGGLFFGFAGFLIGLYRGSGWGALILSVVGYILGWILGSNTNALVALVFLAGRLFFAGFICGFIAASFTPHSSGWGHLVQLIRGLVLVALGGAAILGLYRISIVTLAGRKFASLKYEVIRQGLIGSWLGGLAGLTWIYSTAPDIGDLKPVALAWFFLYSLYHLLDHTLFARPWIFI